MFGSFEKIRAFIVGLLKSLSGLNGTIRHFDLHSKNIMIDLTDGVNGVKIIDYEAIDICSVEPFNVQEECAFLDPDCVTPNTWWLKQKCGKIFGTWMKMKWEAAKRCKTFDEVAFIYSFDVPADPKD